MRTALLGPTLFLTGQTATRWFADCTHLTIPPCRKPRSKYGT